MLLEGKRIIITGGVTGIGKATVLGAVREGAQVVSMSRAAPGEDRVTQTIDAARELGKGPVHHLQVDVTNREQVDAAFTQAIDLMDGMTGMVNSAGYEHQIPTEDLPEDMLVDQLTIHINGTHFTNVAAFRHFKEVGGGDIVNYASYAGVCGMPMMAAYSAGKGGVIAYTRSVAKDWAAHDVKVNVICPGVQTEMYQDWLAAQNEERRAQTLAWEQSMIWLGGRLGDVNEAANLNIFLLSDMANFITGQTLDVGGGMTIMR